jgi:N-acetyl-anhydromuramyl-L-alanine amidase AmpD
MSWILPEAERIASPNFNKGREGVTLDTIVLHYTAGQGNADALGKFFAAKRSSSAHFGIGRPGEIRQYVKISDTAWHAGDGGNSRLPEAGTGTLASTKRRPKYVNRRSVGIEICNVGFQVQKFKIEKSRTFTGRHRNPRSRSSQWESFTQEQVKSLRLLVAQLRLALPTTLLYVCGHEDVTHYDVSSGSKLDPGPAFPWDLINWGKMGLTRILYDFNTKAWVQA